MMAVLNGTKQYHDFVTEVEKLPAFTNNHQNCELILDDNDEDIGFHNIIEINIKDDDNESITIGMNEEAYQSVTEPSDDENVSSDIPNENINQEIINYVYENLLVKGVNNESSSNNLDPNDKVVKNLRATSKKEELDDNDQKKTSSETVEETREGNRAIIKKDEYKLSLKSPVLVEGKCFISSDTIYFVSEFNQILKNSSIIRVKYDTLLLAKYAQELNIIPKWLKIQPDESQSFVFTSLLDKDDIYDSISNMIKYAIDSKQKLETNPTPYDRTQTISQKNKLNSNGIKSSPDFSENVLIIKDVDDMISMNLYPEEIKLLEENEFYSDLKYATSLYINKDFKEVYYNVFSKITEKNPYYEFYKQKLDPQGANYDQFNELSDTIQTPSGYSFDFKYNISLTKAKRKVYGIFKIPTRSDINETIKLFFFDSCIVLQTQINFVSILPILKSFRAVITAVIHDVPSEDGSGKNATQIDMLYGAYFFEFSFFKSFVINNLLPLLEIACLKFKICVNECIKDIYKNKALRERGIEISNINNIFRASNSSGSRSCITNNEKSRYSDAKNRTLDGFKNQIINPQNNEIIINTKHIKNIVGNYINEAMHVNPMVTPSNKIPNFAFLSIITLMYIYMNFIHSLKH
ncbi:conserved rodent malaria protein, unknown function [Plasmodium vinckei lentum]|uniref:GRAM domain-containing protein n=1 Tax=Plasmodium vinckei lentum TaxID=138297 RepID=A0A6V7SVE7_PLAVN|nr:conserved rodent malaria protein, unknown function [Plasmodium vinckei lentum]